MVIALSDRLVEAKTVKMWHSRSIVSIKATRSVLEYFCISPFQGRNRFHCTYYISFFFVYGIAFSISFYLSLIYSREVFDHAKMYDTFYFVKEIKRVLMGPCFCIGIIVSLCSRSAQLQLQERMAALDVELKSQLGIEPSFRRLNIEFVVCCVFVVVYNFGANFYYDDFYIPKLELGFTMSQIYYGCFIFAGVYFYCFGFYAGYWARVYIKRSEYVLDALKATTSRGFLPKSTLTNSLKLAKLLFGVRESIQNAFGSILFMITLVMTLDLAEASFGTVHCYERETIRNFLWLDYLFWFSMLWAEFTFIFVFFNKIGDVVSQYAQYSELIYIDENEVLVFFSGR